MAYVNPASIETTGESLYQDDYYAAGRAKFGGLTRCAVRMFTLARVLKLIQLMDRRAGRILDIGCGRGQFVEMLAARGYDCVGTEIRDYPLSRRERGRKERVTYLVGDLLSLHLTGASFDAVCLWNVLEHVDCPVAILKEVRRLLAPGGVLLLSLPNVDSVIHRLTGDGWFHLDIPRHRFHFSERAVRALLRRMGFRTLVVSHYSLQYGPYGLVQSLMNWLGWPKNALYEILKSNPVHVKRTYSLPFRAMALCAYYMSMPLCVLPSLALSLVGRGEVMSVWATASR